MKARITKFVLLVSVVVFSGCVHTNPEKARRTITQWIPPGTAQDEAIRTMKQHGFDCGPSGRPSHYPEGESVYCFWHETKILKNTLWVFVHFKDGKVESIGHIGTGNNFFVPRPERAALGN